MPSPSNRWAQRRFGWGIAFAVASVLLLIWLLPIMFPGTPAAAPTPTSSAPLVDDDAGGMAADVAAAQATLDAARSGPAAIGEVMAAANTVVAATAAPADTPTPVPPPGGQIPAASPGTPPLFSRFVDTIPALTAVVTFLGLVFTSLMKWRSDLRDADRQEFLIEQQRLTFVLEQERHELEQARALFDLERRRFQLEADRKQFELKQMEARLLERKDD